MRRNFKAIVALMVTFAMLMAVCPQISFAADVTYELRDLNAGSDAEVKLSDYQTYETDHFVIIYDTDGENTITDSQLTELETVLENCWTLFIDKMGMEPTSTSVHASGDKVTQYKTNVVVMGTGVDHYYLAAGAWGAYGSVDTAGYPYFMCSVTAITSPTVVAHEFGHAVHYAQGDNAWEGNIYLGPWFEAVANWFAEQYIYEYMNSSTTQWSHLYLRANHLTKMNGRGYYEAWPILQYLTEDPDGTGVYGDSFVQQLLGYNSGSTNTLFWEVLEANNGDLTVADTVGMYASHMADFDFNNKSRYDTAINNVMNGSFFWQQRYTVPEEIGETGRYAVPIEKAPQAMGYNIIPLDFTAGNVSVTLNSETDVEGADWRARLVKVSSSGAYTYSNLFSDGESMSINATSTDELYLTVAATPSLDSMARHTITGWATHSTEANFPYEDKTQYPYSVTLSGATPMKRPTPSGYFKTHSNGGGKVAYTASVASTAYVGPNAVVMGNATVSDNAVIDGYAIVGGNATVSGNAYVGDNAILFDRATVTDNARVIENACIYVDYKVSGNAVVKGSTLGLYNGTATDAAVTYGDFFEDAGHTITGGAFSGYHTANDNTYSKTIQGAFVRPYVLNLRSRYEFDNNLRDTYSYTDLYGEKVAYENGSAVFDGENFVELDASAISYKNGKITLGANGSGTALVLGDEVLSINNDTVSFMGASVACDDEWKNIRLTMDGASVTLNVNGVTDSVSDATTLLDCAMAGKCYIGKGFDGKIDYVRVYDENAAAVGQMEEMYAQIIDTTSSDETGTLNSRTENESSDWYGWSSTSSAVTVDGGLNITGAITGTIAAPKVSTDKFVIEFDPEGGSTYPDHGVLDADGSTVLFAHRYATDASALHVGRGEINASIRGSESVSDTTGQARLANFVGERLASGTLRLDRGAIDFSNGERIRIVAENGTWTEELASAFEVSENYTDNLASMSVGDEIYIVSYGTVDEYSLFTPATISVYKGNFTGFGGFKIAGGSTGETASYKNLVISAVCSDTVKVKYVADGEVVKSIVKVKGSNLGEYYYYENGVNDIYYANSDACDADKEIEMTKIPSEGLDAGEHFILNDKAYKTVGENLIKNSNFAYGLLGWYNGAGGEATSDYFSLAGDGTIKALTNEGIAGNGALYRAWDVEIGKTYLFTYTSDVENKYHVVSQKNDISETGDGTVIGTSTTGENSFVFTAEKEYVQINFRWLAGNNTVGNFGLYEIEDAESDRVNTTIKYKCGNSEIKQATVIGGFVGDVIDLTDESIAPVTIVSGESVYVKDESNAASYTVSATGEVVITYSESDIQSIESVSATVIGDNLPVLPTTLTATTSDGTMEVTVTAWDFSTLEEGENTVYGTVEGTAIKAEATVTVLAESFALPDMTSVNGQTTADSSLTKFPLAITGEYYIEMDVTYASFGDFWITMKTSANAKYFGTEQVALGHNISGGFRPVNGNGSGGRAANDANLTTLSTNTNYRILVKADASTDKYTVTITKPDGSQFTAENFGFRRNATSIDSIVMFTNNGKGSATAKNVKVYYPGYATAIFVTEDGTLVREISGDVQSGSFTVSETVGYVMDEDGNGKFYEIPETVVDGDCTVVVYESETTYPVLEDAYAHSGTVYGLNTTHSDSIFVAAAGGSDRAPLVDGDGVALRGDKDPSTLGSSRVGLFQFPVLELEDGKAAIAHFYVRSWHGNTFSNSNTSIRMAGYAVNDDTWLTGTCTPSSLTLLENYTNAMFTSRSTNTVGYVTLDITEPMKAAHKMGLKTITIRLNAAWGAAYIAEREATVAGAAYEGKTAYVSVEDGTYITVSGATSVTKKGSVMSVPGDGVTVPEGGTVKMYTDIADAVAFTNGERVYPVRAGETSAIEPESGGYYPATIGVKMVSGAQVRYGGGVDADGKINEGNGLRFISQIYRNDSLAAVDGAEFGIIITPEDDDDQVVTIPAEKWQDDAKTVFTAALVNLAPGNYNRNFFATPYITVDGQTFHGSGVTRSIYKVAAGLLARGVNSTDNNMSDTSGSVDADGKENLDYSIKNQKLQDVLQAYINQVGIRLTMNSDGTFSQSSAYTGDDIFFTVESKDNGNGTYTITIVPNAEFETTPEIKSWWKEYVRVNNNNSKVKTFISDDSIGEDGVLTFTFEPTTSSN